MLSCYFLSLPVHSGSAFVVDLHPIHADVALACSRIAGDDARECYEASAVLWPALQYGKVEERELVTLDDIFTWTSRNCFGKEFAYFREHGQHLQFFQKTLGRLQVEQLADASGD